LERVRLKDVRRLEFPLLLLGELLRVRDLAHPPRVHDRRTVPIPDVEPEDLVRDREVPVLHGLVDELDHLVDRARGGGERGVAARVLPLVVVPALLLADVLLLRAEEPSEPDYTPRLLRLLVLEDVVHRDGMSPERDREGGPPVK